MLFRSSKQVYPRESRFLKIIFEFTFGEIAIELKSIHVKEVFNLKVMFEYYSWKFIDLKMYSNCRETNNIIVHVFPRYNVFRSCWLLAARLYTFINWLGSFKGI